MIKTEESEGYEGSGDTLQSPQSITIKYERKTETELSSGTFPANEIDAIKFENCDESPMANLVKFEFAEYSKTDATKSESVIPKDTNKNTVTLEKIPKKETELICSDDNPISPTNPEEYNDDNNRTPSNSDSAWDPDSDVERDPFADVDCDPSFSQESVRVHGMGQAKRKIRPLRTLQCEFCKKYFGREESLAAHITLSHESDANSDPNCKLKPYKCQDCPSSFRSLSNLNVHIMSHTKERRVKCPEPNCEKTFKFKSNLKVHFERAHVFSDKKKNKFTSLERSFKCQEPNCDKIFKTKRHLQNHLSCHSKTRPFKCPHLDCDRTFKNKEGVTQHKKFHTGEQRYKHLTDKPFKCEECDRAFCLNYKLTAHLKTHDKQSDNVIFKCLEQSCNKTFKNKQNLKLHISNIHTNKDVRPFQCPQPNCDKRFKYKESVQDHLSTHTGIRPFKCIKQGCSATFARVGNLNHHAKTKHATMSHKNEPPLKCPIPNCERVFKRKDGLQCHVRRVHSEDKPFKCQETDCSAMFKTTYELQKHQVYHSESVALSFKCPHSDCNRAFKSSASVRGHLASHKGAPQKSHITTNANI